jgi:hypothetical protein
MCSAGRNSSASTGCASSPSVTNRCQSRSPSTTKRTTGPSSPDEVRAGQGRAGPCRAVPCRAPLVRTGHRTTLQTTPTRVQAPPSVAVRPSKPAPVAAVLLLRLRLRLLLRRRAPSASPLDCRRQRRWRRSTDESVLRLALRRPCRWEKVPRLGRGQGPGRDGCGVVGIEDVERPGDDDDDGIGRRPRSCNRRRRRRRRGRLRHAADAHAGGDVAGGVRCWCCGSTFVLVHALLVSAARCALRETAARRCFGSC